MKKKIKMLKVVAVDKNGRRSAENRRKNKK